MIIEDFIPYPGTPPILANLCNQACQNPCDNIYEPLLISISASHGCDDAEFDCYIKLYEETIENNMETWLYIKRLNLNTNDHKRTTGNNPAIESITLDQAIVNRANQGKGKTRERNLCCSLDIKLFACHYPSEAPYESGETNLSLPFTTSDGKYLPPLGLSTYNLQNRNNTRVHDNIIDTTITRISDGVVLAQNVIWYGGIELDLCKELEDPGDTGPVKPVL